MSTMEKAQKTQLENIRNKTGKSLEQLFSMLERASLAKHGEMVSFLKSELDLGHGDANTVVHLYRRSLEGELSDEAQIDQIYSGAKANLRPIHDRILQRAETLGPFETAPKKAYVSLRRKKQFATVGPATKTQVEVGLNGEDLTPGERLERLPAGRMTAYRVRLTTVEEVDEEFLDWFRAAYESAG